MKPTLVAKARQGWDTPIFFGVGNFKYKVGISADMPLRLSDALGTHAAFWSGMQMEYELWPASRKARPKDLPFCGLFSPSH